jgi:hypothetical protein
VLRDNPFIESLVNLGAFIAQNVFSHFDARIAQLPDAFATVARIYVRRADHYVFDSRLDYRICACSGAPCRGARLQSNVQRGASRYTRTEITKALNLSMIASRFPMMPFRYYSIVNDQNRSDRWIWAGLAERLFCLVQCSAHEFFISGRRHCSDRSIIVFACRGNAASALRQIISSCLD